MAHNTAGHTCHIKTKASTPHITSYLITAVACAFPLPFPFPFPLPLPLPLPAEVMAVACAEAAATLLASAWRPASPKSSSSSNARSLEPSCLNACKATGMLTDGSTLTINEAADAASSTAAPAPPPAPPAEAEVEAEADADADADDAEAEADDAEAEAEETGSAQRLRESCRQQQASGARREHPTYQPSAATSPSLSYQKVLSLPGGTRRTQENTGVFNNT